MDVRAERGAVQDAVLDDAARVGIKAGAAMARQRWTAPSLRLVAVDEVTRAGPAGTTDSGVLS